MRLEFTKMQGLGNDFVVLDATRAPIRLTPDQYRFLADRHFGIGCDQILRVEPPRLPGTDFHYRIFNADGSEVEQCGNGARCFARFVHERGLSDKTVLDVGTAAGPIRLYLEADGRVRVNMGPPRFAPRAVPFEADGDRPLHPLAVAGRDLEIAVLSMGNPHAVLEVEDLDQAPVQALGPLIERHPRFPQRVNVGFMQVLAPHHLRLRVWERGSGETLACGTGACAAAAAAIRNGRLQSPVRVELPGGSLTIAWAGGDAPVWMTGPAETVFTGVIDL